jgi:hypothetical protein
MMENSNNKLYKVRQLTTHNSTGNAFGITIPSHIANRNKDVCFKISQSGTAILLESGAKI